VRLPIKSHFDWRLARALVNPWVDNDFGCCIGDSGFIPQPVMLVCFSCYILACISSYLGYSIVTLRLRCQTVLKRVNACPILQTWDCCAGMTGFRNKLKVKSQPN
jgi:hypothetical protein